MKEKVELFNPGQYFSGKTSSFFYGISYSYNEFLLKLKKIPSTDIFSGYLSIKEKIIIAMV